MPTIDKVLQVGTLLAISANILACAPQKNASVLPANTIQKTQVAEVSVPVDAVKFANSNSAESIPKPIQNSIPVSAAEFAPPKSSTAKPEQLLAKTEYNEPPEEFVTPPHETQLVPKVAYNFYGTSDQPGYQIQAAIYSLFEQGLSLEEAAQQVIALITDQNQIIRDALAMAAVSEQPNLSVAFVLDIAQVTALTEATKRTMENNPGQLTSIISLGVTLYPNFTKDIIAAAALTGEMTEQDALLLAIAAGADPTLLASSTAAGADGPGLSAFAATPLGSGIGAGGTGGGDTTASTN